MTKPLDHIDPIFSGFEAFYASDLRPPLVALEPRRRKLVRDCSIIIGAAALIAALIGGGIAIFFHSVSGVLCVMFIALIGAVLALNWRMEDDYVDVNDVILAGVARFLKLKHRSDVRQPRSIQTFKKYGLVPSYNVMECGDVIEGEWASVSFAVSEAFLSKRRSSRKGEKTVFSGQLLRIDRRANVDVPVVLVKRRWPFSTPQRPFDGAHRVSGSAESLDRRFFVWSTSPDKGRQTAALLASPAERLLAIHGRHALTIGLVKNRLYVAVGNGHRLTPGSMLRPLTSSKRMRQAAMAFKSILDTVELAGD